MSNCEIALRMVSGRTERHLESEQLLEVGADVQLFGDAHAAVQLNRLFGNKTRSTRYLDLGRPRRGTIAEQGCAKGDRAGLLAGNGHVHQPMFDDLIGRQRLAELLTSFGVGNGRVEDRAHAAGCLRRSEHHGPIQRRLNQGVDRIDVIRCCSQVSSSHRFSDLSIKPNGDLVQLEIAGSRAIDEFKGGQSEPRGLGRHDKQCGAAA